MHTEIGLESALATVQKGLIRLYLSETGWEVRAIDMVPDGPYPLRRDNKLRVLLVLSTADGAVDERDAKGDYMVELKPGEPASLCWKAEIAHRAQDPFRKKRWLMYLEGWAYFEDDRTWCKFMHRMLGSTLVKGLKEEPPTRATEEWNFYQ